MKTPTARQLPSGSWFVRVKVDGVEHSITRPTKKEAEREAIALKSGAKKSASFNLSKNIGGGDCGLHRIQKRRYLSVHAARL